MITSEASCVNLAKVKASEQLRNTILQNMQILFDLA